MAKRRFTPKSISESLQVTKKNCALSFDFLALRYTKIKRKFLLTFSFTSCFLNSQKNKQIDMGSKYYLRRVVYRMRWIKRGTFFIVPKLGVNNA